MAVKSVKVTVEEATKLVCPYTGKPLVVYMHVQPGSITYSAPDAFALQVPVKGLPNLIDRASMRNGVSGAVSVRGVPRDEYTGEAMSLCDLGDDMYCYRGGFNPRAACDSLEEFIRKASMRNGKTPVAIEAPAAVTDVKRRRALRHKGIEVSDETERAAYDALVKSGRLDKKTSVHVQRGR